MTASLLGRERELTEIAAGLDRARAGRGQLFLVAGEPGIGKTRLVEAAAERAAAEGMLVLWGRCWETGGAPSFWPWVQLLRALIRDRDLDRLQTELDGNAAWVAQLVPDLREQLPDLDQPDALDSDRARFALFDAISSFLRSASRSDPIVMVLDDVHAADPGSLLLLDFLAHGIHDASILVLVTYQEAAAHRRQEVERLIGALGAESRTLVLRGFGEEELTRLLTERGVESVTPELVRALRETTEGNPFFADGVARLLVAGLGALEAPAGEPLAHLPLPDTVRESIRRRLEPLGREGIAMLEAAAVVGREFHIGTLELAAGAERERLIQLLDDAQAAGLVGEVPGSIGRFRFTHNLIRETLYAGLGAVARVRLHRAAGEAIEQRYGAVDDRLAELAHHFAASAAIGDARKALDYAERAGRRAMDVLSYEHAAELFQLALSASELVEPDPGLRAELLLALGLARVRSGDPSARDALLTAARAARAVGRADLLASAALGVRAFALAAGTVDETVVDLVKETLDTLEPGDSELRARLLARLSLLLYHSTGDSGRRAEIAEEAVAMARRLGDVPTLAYVLSNCQLATWCPPRSERMLAWAEELFELTEQAGDAELALSTRNRHVDLLLELDDLPAADVAIDVLARMASEHPDPRSRAWLPLQQARRALMEGRFADAERLISEAAAVAERLEEASISMLAVAQTAAMRFLQGRMAELEPAARRFGNTALPAWRAALTWMYCELGRDAEARRELEHLAADGFGELPLVEGFLLVAALSSETCRHLGDADRAGELYDLLHPFADRNVVTIHSFYAGPVSRYLGMLAATRREWDLAGVHLEAANAAATRQGARPIIALLRLDEAMMLAARDEPGDRERALELAAEGATIARDLGQDGVLRRLAELSAALGAPLAARDDDEQAAAEADTATEAAAGAGKHSLTREGDVWTFTYEDRAVRVRDSKGLRYLATLLASPGVEIHAVELVGAAPGGGAPHAASATAAAGLEVRGAGADDAGPALDAEAKAAYRRRLEDLRAELDEAESWGDPERAARAREEMDFIASELASAVGLGGRDRTLASTAERARVNATRAIRSALKRIGEHDEALGRELGAAVRTGTFCAYEPLPGRAGSWRVEGL